MALFQHSVSNKYLQELDKQQIETAYNKFIANFGNAEKQNNIREAKEEQYQEGFLNDLFVNVLGYTKNPEPNFNITTEYKNEKDAKKADGAILKEDKPIAIIELKGTDTIELDKVEQQAFNYKNNQSNCKYIITSNFEKLRFYIENAIDYEEFNLFNLSKESFSLLFLCLSKDNLLNDIPLQIKQSSLTHEENITKKLYSDYSTFKNLIFTNIVQLNPQFDKLLLYKKTQKLLDRFLFIFFAEDRLLLPPNSIREIIKQWERLKEDDEYFPLYDRFKKYFTYLNIGHKGKQHEIFAYNGGLFEPDEILDNIKVDDQILFIHTHKLSDYDYQSDVDVNILGHIFEHSLNEIEEVQAELEGQTIEKNKTKRKKDGIYYTPKYITKYIVDNTLGTLCDEKKKELGINEDEFSYKKRKEKRKELLVKLETYRNWLLKLTICDPACGSGAFLNQALNYLIEEHKIIDELQAKVSGASIVFQDVENKILENNLYGVDLNDESIEIAKLSLWLHTAQKGRKLTSLNKNIKCGNSLIDDVNIAGEKAFNWKNEFPEIFTNGGFDVVIGNPPYTYRNAISEIEKDFFKKNYSSTEGNFDLYKFFIEKLNVITKQNGYSSLIVPNTFLSAITYKKLREIIVNEFRIIEFFDLGLNVFENVVVESIIFTFCKQKVSNQNTQIKIDRERTGKFFSLEKSYIIDLLKYYTKDHSFNINLSSELDTIINKCQLNSIELGNIAYCTVGINTGYIKEELTSNNKVDDRYHKMLNGKNIGRNFVNWDEEWIMYDVDFVKSKGDKGRALPPEYVFLKEKILVQRTRRGMKRKLVCYYDTEQYYNLNRISNIVLTNDDYSLKYIYVLLNSELLDFYFNKYFNEYEVKPVHLAKLPIKILNLELQKSFTERADIMLFKNKEFLELKTKFIKLLTSKYNDLKITNKLEDWSNLDFNGFSKELAKQKIKLLLSEQSEWLEYFEKEKAKAIELQNEINKTDKEIDNMVYELYGLTEEEIKIVEGE